MIDQAFLHDEGVTISAPVGIAVSGASSLWVKYKKPDGTSGKWSGVANGSDVEYTTTWPDLDVAGIWEYQSQVVGLSGLTAHGSINHFEVKNPLH